MPSPKLSQIKTSYLINLPIHVIIIIIDICHYWSDVVGDLDNFKSTVKSGSLRPAWSILAAGSAEVFSEVRIVVIMVDEVNGEENAERLSSAQHQ
jgi:hypothetical protein